MTDPGPATLSTPDAPLRWETFARTGEWRRALATARLSGVRPEVTDVLEDVVNVQDAVRARKLPQAKRVGAGLREALDRAAEVGLTGEAALLRSLLRPGTLEAALAALDGLGRGTGGETEPEALRVRLVPALDHPLTRPEALNLLGVLHALREEAGEARALFGEAVAADAGHYRALTNLGNLELEGGNPAAAEAQYREALRLNPEYDGAHHNLGVALRRQGKVQESVGAIRRAQRLSVRRAQEDSREEMRGRGGGLATNPQLVRWVLIAAGALVLFLLLRSGGGA
ncbi:tetratricopeptide repeat protein [Deinococcus hopiensis]|uniref:Tetratricopeptide repeat-containing protein n=1 Tax=Deinococcus hopiensis KR-140 TaxID=695939 RepID=A0A1W1VGD5_9DEIO|nr:tetratricopeptide repeat protein [Deinococcus hopiensis]SMB92415.1 Tetratricopeptide repeat-containing protein [Deinococcus hopiensis KR-140]